MKEGIDEVEAHLFYEKHGYPLGVDRVWIERMLRQTELRLLKLSAMNAPAIIISNEKKLIATRDGWLAAWDREHPTE